MDKSADEKINFNWQVLYRLGGVAALIVVVTGLSEIAITFLPGGNTLTETVLDWFNLLQNHGFIGLRNLGLLNIIMTLVGLPMTLAVCAAHRRVNPAFAMLALIISYLGAAVFFATNRAFPMLDLSYQYASATTEAQKAALLAAGQSMISVGQSHTAGTFLAFFISEIAGLTVSAVMLRGGIFGKPAASIGLVAYTSFLIFEVIASFVSGVSGVAMVFAMIGGLLSMAWHILIARRLLQLSQGGKDQS